MSGGNSVYSPLPQSNSDTDESSEVELHSLHGTRIINRIPVAPDPKPEVILNGQKQKVINYKPLDNERDVSIMLNGFQANTDEVSILTPNVKSKKLSTLRRICFIFSLLLCVFTIVLFIWVLPCDIGSCPSAVTSPHVKSWETPLLQVELGGPISVVPSTFGKSQNLVFLFKNGSLSEDLINNSLNSTGFLPTEGGVVSLFGHNGDIAWWVKLKRIPKDIDCSLLDVDSDGYKDCIVVGDNNLLKAIQPLSGTELWDVHTNNDKKNIFMYKLDFPLVIPDVDNDGIQDLLTSCSLNENLNQNYLILVSGKTGTVIGDPTVFSDCIDLHICSLEQDFNVTYTCVDKDRKESFRTTSLLKICNSMNFLSHPPPKFLREGDRSLTKNITQHEKETNLIVDGRHLFLENKGTCPNNCSVTVSMKDERDGQKNQTIYYLSFQNGYGMKPVTIGSGEIKGFVIKFWEWPFKIEEKNSEALNPFTYNYQNSSYEVSKSPRVKRLQVSKRLDEDMMMRGIYPNSKRYKRKSVDHSQKITKTLENKNLVAYNIKEKMLLLTFKKNLFRFVNTSHSDITQMCKDSFTCLPDLTSQNKSLILTDLDQDGSHELISFTTTYYSGDKQDGVLSSGNTWKLISKVRLIRLESELPKLYEPVV